MPSQPSVYVVGRIRLHRRGRFWYAHYTTPAGQVRESLRVTTLQAAQDKARQIAEMLDRVGEVSPEQRKAQKTYRFADFAREFETQFHEWAPSTWQPSSGRIRRLVEEWGELPLGALQARTIEAYLARRQQGVWKYFGRI